MRSFTTEADIEAVLDSLVGVSYGSYYYERVRRSNNVMALERYLKRMVHIKGSDLAERLQIYKDMEDILASIQDNELIEDINTFNWVKDVFIEFGLVREKPEEKAEGKIIPLFRR